MVAHSGRETAIVPLEGSRTSFSGVVADEDDFVAVRKGAKPRAFGDMPLIPARTGNQNSRRGNGYAALAGQDQSWCPDVSLVRSNNQIQRAARVASLKRLWLQNGARWKRVTG